MLLFLTSVLPFLAHDHPSAVAFLTCRHHNFHSSIIPEFLSNEERVKSFSETRQQNHHYVNRESAYKNWYNLFVQTPLMQFSPSLVLRQEDCHETILKPLLGTKYFSRTLQQCTVGDNVQLTNDLLQSLSKIQSLTKLDLFWLNNSDLEIIINTFPSLETLTIENADDLDPTTVISISSQSSPPASTKTLRNLTIREVDALFATQFVPQFSNMQKLQLRARKMMQRLDLLPLTSSLPLLTDLSFTWFSPYNIDESLKNLGNLTSLQFYMCKLSELSFISQENSSLPKLTTLLIRKCDGLSSPSSFASSLSHAPNLRLLEISRGAFDNDCLQYLQNTVHLRKLDLSASKIIGDSRSLTTLMQNLFQLEELNLSHCQIGNRGAVAGAIYSTNSRLRVLNLSYCELVSDDLNGIGALKNVLEDLDLSYNRELTSEGLVHCKELMTLNVLKLSHCDGINDVSPLNDCFNLEELDVSRCDKLTDDSFKVFSEEPNSFPDLRILNLTYSKKLTEKVFEHLSKNNRLMYQLKELDISGATGMLFSSTAARNSICQLKGLRRLCGILSNFESETDRSKLKGELLQRLKNLDVIY